VQVALPSLQSIKIFCPRLSDDVLIEISQNCARLETLHVFESSRFREYYVTEVGVRAVLQGCPLLRWTDVEYAVGINTELHVELARRQNFTSLCPRDWRGISDELTREVLKVSPSEMRFRSQLVAHGRHAGCMR
jgi:hypothetical protein